MLMKLGRLTTDNWLLTTVWKMGMVGIEPTREVISRVFETRTSACSVTSPVEMIDDEIELHSSDVK